jgi:hypothetical protein
MHISEPSVSTAADAKWLEHLAAAFAAFRRVNKPGRWVPSNLRSQAVAAMNAGVSTGAIERACRVSRAQLTRWREAADVLPQPRVLSVVDGIGPLHSSSDTSIELRVGAWRISLSRATD